METGTIHGTVKWYDMVKGYGFIARDDGGDDLFVHRSAAGYDGLNEGDRVTCIAVRGQKGANAERVQVIEKSSLPPRQPRFGAGDRGFGAQRWPSSPIGSLDTLPLQTGTLKRYDAEKGFGFITPDDGSSDVFVHRSAAGVHDIAAGDRLEFRLGQGPKGPRAEQVRRLTADAFAGFRAAP